MVTKTLRKELFEYTSSMASVEASNDSFDLETSFFKQCSFKVKVLYAESEKSECIYRNNKACTPGLSYCKQEACNTAGDDEAKLWAVCQPESAVHRFPNDFTMSSTSKGTGNKITCPTGSTIAFGWAIQSTNNAGGHTCVGANCVQQWR